MDDSSLNKKTKKEGNSSNSQKKSAKVQKKTRKQVKGQKDIRTLIKPKKNELVTYSKDFDLICKQSGIDVDPEQLQLAIALSKSLQDSETVHNNNTNIQKSLTTNQRKGIIRTTLQEYGFKVPDIKHRKSNKVNRHRKHYKLLLATDVQKQEKIANKYAQILFTNVSICCVNEDNINCENTNSFLYRMSTNISYEHIKSDAIYYVDNLVEIPLTDKHHILRDWSEIPGRPRSPVRDLPSNIYFKSLDCSEEELASILSGTIEAAQEVVRRIYCSNKLTTLSSKKDDINNPNNDRVDPVIQHTCSNALNIEIKENLSENNKCYITDKSIVEETFMMPPPVNRSCSPDIFDDEVTIVMDKSKDTITLQEDLLGGPLVREQSDYMDLTECVNVLNCNAPNFKQKSLLSQESNKTRMNPNDFMELTGCVNASSQKIIIDTESGNFSGKENCSPNVIKNSQNDIMDLTQLPNLNNSSQMRKNDENKSLDDTIIVVDEDYSNFNSDSNLSKSPPSIQKSDIIDLVASPQFPNKLNSSGHNFVIQLNQGPEEDENGKKGTNNFDFRNDKLYSSHIDTADSKENLDSSRCDSFVKDKKERDSMDLTQSSNSEDSLSFVKIDPIDMALNDVPEKNIIENQRNSPVISYHSNDEEYHCGDIPNSPIFMNDSDDYRFDSPLNDIPLNDFNSPNHNKSKYGIQEKKENQDVDLTQSSPSEYIVNVDHESNSGDKSLDDTIVLNDYYYSHDMVENEIRDDEIDPVHLGNSNPYKDVREQISQDKNKIIMNEYSNYNNDVIENVIENLSTINQNTNLTLTGYVERGLFKYSEAKSSTSIRENDIVSNSKENYGLYNINNDSDEKHRVIDLTQYTDCAEDVFRSNIDIPVEVGERNNFSTDYDSYVQNRNSNSGSDILVINPNNDTKNFVEKEKGSSIDEAVTNSSQNTAAFQLSDDEFNYSINQRKEDDNSIRLDCTRFNIGGTSTIDEFLNRNSLSKSKLRCSCGSNIDPNCNENKDNICQPEIAFTNEVNLLGVAMNKKSKSCTEIECIRDSTPSKSLNNENILLAQTPKHNDYIIKTDVTPMPNYEMMTSPERNAELDKFGIKPLKRKRAIQILTHIYDQTHPVMEILSDTEDYSSPSKIRKRNDHTSFPRRAIASQIDLVGVNNYIEPGPSLHLECLSQKSSKSCIMELSKCSKKSPQSSMNVNKECNLYEETKQLPDIKNIECCQEDWVFQKREKAKVHSCRVPLHIAFHNYVSCRQTLREAILRYEPINIDDIHKCLVATGYRYNPKDLLKFMDKKCITVKTADNNRNTIK